LASMLVKKINIKTDTSMNQAGIDNNETLKNEFRKISSSVVKEVSVGGWRVFKRDTINIGNGKWRGLVIIEFPISLAYKNYLHNLEQSTSVSAADKKKIKNTDAFKELEEFVSQFTGA